MFIFRGQVCHTFKNFHSWQALLLVSLLIFSATKTEAQGIDYTGNGGRHTITGRIFFPSGRRTDKLDVKVKLESVNNAALSTFADANGSFSFRNLLPGTYTVVIEAGEEYETARETVYIDDPGGSSLRGPIMGANTPRTYNVPIYLVPKMASSSAENRPGVLNAALANVPKAAVELYDKAADSIRAGDSTKAIELLRGAISIYPTFALALNELGVQYLKLGQFDKAIEALYTTLKLTPNEITPRMNYAVALLEKKDYTGAETQLRQVIKKNDSMATAHMYLGIALLKQRNYDEAEKELERSINLGGSNMGMVHYYLGGLYWRNRDYKRAADELELYLKLTPKAPDAEKARAAIKELRSKS